MNKLTKYNQILIAILLTGLALWGMGLIAMTGISSLLSATRSHGVEAIEANRQGDGDVPPLNVLEFRLVCSDKQETDYEAWTL